MRTFGEKPKTAGESRRLPEKTREPNAIYRVQRSVGNQAVQRSLRDELGDGKAVPKSSEAANRTDMPSSLKLGLEALSGVTLSGVRVHRNSPKPAQLNALAYAKGRDIYLGPGQEQYLPHEGWHVVQQLQGRVQLTTREKGAAVNDDPELEREADVMGAKASVARGEHVTAATAPQRSPIVQRVPQSDSPTWNISDVYPGDPEHEAVTQGDAVYILYNLNSLFRDVRRTLKPDADASLIAELDDSDLFRHIRKQVITDFRSSNDRPLTTEQVDWLDTYDEHFARPYAEAKQRLRNRASDPLDAIGQMDTAELADSKQQLNEKLHELFIQGVSDPAVKKISIAITEIDEYKAAIDETLEYAGNISEIVRNEDLHDTISMMQGHSSELGELLGKVKAVTDIAASLDTLLGGSGAHGAHDDIERFRASIEGLDAGMGLIKAVPVLGQLWSEYILPATLNILNRLDEIARLVEKHRRREAAFLINQRRRGGVPQIPEGYEEYFPGGQPVLDFMWSVVHGDTPKVTPAVEKFFAENASKFSAAAYHSWGQDELETSSSTSWWPFDEDDEVKNLVSWVRRNEETVWAQLYGNQRWE